MKRLHVLKIEIPKGPEEPFQLAVWGRHALELIRRILFCRSSSKRWLAEAVKIRFAALPRERTWFRDPAPKLLNVNL
ncbi:hypothetical protein CENSYa_1024 [Cenarchaeum symbiosum A]|uniref:Uncharacterized protein n=1 Tax=Cenarchaeum symbiosum (strain A) TaxID=414004 RepID=A0RWD9_CENSY|nr:hypothetical protein CENSYa_1024 [Cenarchaeum symbiosum A]